MKTISLLPLALTLVLAPLPVTAPVALAAAKATGSASQNAAREVEYAPAPEWVAPPPEPTETPAPANAAFRWTVSDSQGRITTDGTEWYSLSRIKLLKPQALALGQLTLTWNPATDEAFVHRVAIIRDGQVIDVLADHKFNAIQREDQLEQMKLTGMLTASLAIPGLRVGDEIVYESSIRSHSKVFGTHVADGRLLSLAQGPGAFSLRLSWDAGHAVRWQVSPDLKPYVKTDKAHPREVSIEMRDPPPPVPTEGAPARYNLLRLFEYSDYPAWKDASATFAPLMDRAARIEPGSALDGEAKKIAAASSDPTVRAEQALALVEDQVRYYYVGLNGGNYVPMSAEDTWNNRYGDCKAKTALLLALLRALDIEAEPVLVNSAGGDGIDVQLPGPWLFDHVLVRATIAGKPVLLDGTKLGERDIAYSDLPQYRWLLPVRDGGAELERGKIRPPVRPQLISFNDIDASAGFDDRAKIVQHTILTGDDAYAIDAGLAAMPTDEAKRVLREKIIGDWIRTDDVAWTYDEKRRVLDITATGTIDMDWDGSAKEGHTWYLTGAGFSPPAELHRPSGQDQAAPWAQTFPNYKCWVTRVKVPTPTKGFAWDYVDAPVNRLLAGTHYWRTARMDGNTMGSIMVIRNYVPEVTAEDARIIPLALKDFDKLKSQVYETSDGKGAAGRAKQPDFPVIDDIDWARSRPPARSANKACLSLHRRGGAAADEAGREAGHEGELLRGLADYRVDLVALHRVPGGLRHVLDRDEVELRIDHVLSHRHVGVRIAGLFEQRRVDEARHQIAHLDPFGLPLAVERFGHRTHAELGRRIGRHVGNTVEPRRTGGIEQAASRRLGEIGPRGLCAIDHAPEVDIDQHVDFRLLHFGQRTAESDARVVEHHVDAPAALLGEIGQRLVPREPVANVEAVEG